MTREWIEGYGFWDNPPTSSTWLESVVKELDSAREQHPQPMHSTMEGFAILKEEVDELWEAVKKGHPHSTPEVRAEAIQVAAMAIRFLEDVG